MTLNLTSPDLNTSPDAVLRICGLDKRFGGTHALREVDLDLRPGEVHALLGENGAGKSTLIKILAGVYQRDSGDIEVDGLPWDPVGRAGEIAFVHQDLGLVDSMSVAENVAHVLGFPRRLGLISWRDTVRQAEVTLAPLSATVQPTRLVTQLSQAQKSVVAIARAVALSQARVLILDEPTASLPLVEVNRLFSIIESLRSRGIALIYVTHRLDEVMVIADRVTVLRDGKVAATRNVPDTSARELVADIVGSTPVASFAKPTSAYSRRAVATFRRIQCGGFGPVSFDVHAGEILALVGLEGAGQLTPGRIMWGDERSSWTGDIEVDGRRLAHPSPIGAIRLGLGLVPGKRAEEAAALTRSVRENIFVNPDIPNRRRAIRWIRSRAEKAETADVISAYRIRASSSEEPLGALSGGNQQKVVLARWLSANRRLLLLEDPTVGVDVGARAEIYRLVSQMVQAGAAVMLVSSDFEEVETIATRALVFNRGRIVSEFSGDDIRQDAIMHAAAGAPQEGS